MKKKVIKTEALLKVFNVLNSAKYGKMDDMDKIRVFKIVRKLKPIAEAFEDESKDAAEKLKFEGFEEQLEKAKEYEAKVNKEGAELPMTAEEYNEFIKKFKAYNKLIGDAIKEAAEKENEIEFDGISEEAFNKLMNSNDWTFGQAVALELIINN